jgi:hypothetical protein
MLKRRTSLRSSSLFFAAAALLAVGAGAAHANATGHAARANQADVGTLQVKGRFIAKFAWVDCAADRPATTSCYREVGTNGVIAGLGNVSTAYTLEQDDFGSACGHVHALIPIVVAGKARSTCRRRPGIASHPARRTSSRRAMSRSPAAAGSTRVPPVAACCITRTARPRRVSAAAPSPGRGR